MYVYIYASIIILIILNLKVLTCPQAIHLPCLVFVYMCIHLRVLCVYMTYIIKCVSVSRYDTHYEVSMQVHIYICVCIILGIIHEKRK